MDRDNGSKLIKIRNFQALFEQDGCHEDQDDSESHPFENEEKAGVVPLSFKSQQLAMLELQEAM